MRLTDTAPATVLHVDRRPVGAGETSACGTLLGVLELVEATAVPEQLHNEIPCPSRRPDASGSDPLPVRHLRLRDSVP